MINPAAIIGLSTLVAMSAPLNAQEVVVDQTVQAARIAAKADRHDEAIAGFRRVIALAPERRHEWLLELADQLTWSQRYREAIPLYREAATIRGSDREGAARIGLARALARAGKHKAAVAEYDRALVLDPNNREVRLARAQVLSWDDRLGAAEAAYEGILRDDPGNAEAQRGRVQMLSWRGRHRAAVAAAQELRAERPNDAEVTRILAESLIWMGRPDRAETVLRRQLAADPGNKRLASLLSDVERRNRPEARIDWRSFDQSDNLGITELAVDLRAPLASGRAFIGVRYTRATYRPGQDAGRQITVDRPLIYGGYRLSDAIDLNGAIAVDFIDKPGGVNDHARLTFENYLTYRPNDVLRFDIGASRATFDSEDTLNIGLTATQFGASADVQPDERTVLSGRISRTLFSDGNRRDWRQLEVNRRILNRPRISVGYRHTAFEFRLTGQRGYYNPPRFHSHELVVRGSGNITKSLRWDMRLVGGYETETPGGSRATINAGVSLAQQLGSQLELEAAYDFSTSRTQSSGGFERGIARLMLRARL